MAVVASSSGEDVSSVLSKLKKHWWAAVDEGGRDIPLTTVDQENVVGERAIHIAAWKGDPGDIAWLLDNGAEINKAVTTI